jgi:hypothetical protein
MNLMAIFIDTKTLTSSNMKKIAVFILALLVVTSCSVQMQELKKIEGYSILNKIDFRKYSDKGFLITPEKYSGEYHAIGMIDFIKMPGAVYVKRTKLDENNKPVAPEFGHPAEVEKTWVPDNINIDAVLEDLYKQCVALGADAIINFNVEPNSVLHGGIQNPVTIEGVRITGFAIKRGK